GATADLSGVRPGLAIGIAGPGATVTVSGVGTPVCSGGPGFAGDFQTFQGCLSMR
ncbi:protein kinase, partial [Nocardia nova]|nr:protein kinase [Nocardia nova]